MTEFCDVIVDIADASVDKCFTYRTIDDPALRVGARVLVPFGRRAVEGIVLGFKEDAGVDEALVKRVIRAEQGEPAVLPSLIALAGDVAREAHCPLAAALRLMLPAQMRGGRVKPKTEKAARLAIFGEALQSAKEKQKRAPKRRLLIDLLLDGEEHAVKDLAVLVRDPLAALKALEEQGIVKVFDREVFRSPFSGAETILPDPVLTEGQEEALGEILPGIREGKGAFLLYGVTGSGKTEVYIRAVRECLKLGKTAIVLVPEIVLTPQIVSWFRSRFGNVAAVLHSRLSVGEKYDEWRRVRRGDAKVVIGARSAVFAPAENLGLIIVDEEHEQSYLSDRTPVYDARRVAHMRAAREGAAVVLASATPSILSFAKASRGEYMLLEMPGRVGGRPMPEVFIADMREELRLGNKGIFSGLLLEKLRNCLDRGEQAMLFVNRRGYAPSVMCRKCGETVKCGDCDVAMTYHQSDRRLHCHYCGKTVPMPNTCPYCGSRFLKTCGVGTERVEEEFNRLFPDVPAVRVDADTTAGKNGHQSKLDAFRSGEKRVMIGTQMIAKGLDFPNVTLVGAVLADLTVNLPDFRAPERTFQLLTQAAGRSGRADKAGEVVIQTYKPDHYAIEAAARQDYRAFYGVEFARRRRELYPPFTLLARLLCRAKDEKTAREISGALFKKIMAEAQGRPLWKKRVLLVREDDAPIKRLMGEARAQVFIKMLNHPDAGDVLAYLTALSHEEWPCKVDLEINPPSLA